jgi:dihydrofolate synthase / folylpolyglutamate synthase
MPKPKRLSTFDALHKRLARRGLFHIKPGLERIRVILSALDSPEKAQPAIHVAGTNGKGSVVASLESVLRTAGYRTGLYTSPHLHSVCERIQVNGRPIDQESFVALARDVLRAERRTKTPLTYFEFLTALAFLAFRQLRIDIAILETGLGGLWDATNVITKPLAAVITSIGLDHTQWLGTTEVAIARQKAGIIKSRTPVIAGAEGDAANVIAQQAKKRHAPLLQLGRDFDVRSRGTEWHANRQSFDFYWKGRPQRYQTPLLGRHQVRNAALTLATIHVLRQAGFTIADHAIQQGVRSVRWPGRFQILKGTEGPTLLLDGAHNPPAMRHLIDTIRESTFKSRRKVFVFSAFKDKDYDSMIRIIAPEAASIFVCEMPSNRAALAPSLVESTRSAEINTFVRETPLAALRDAYAAADKDDLLVVTGSLHLVGMLLTQALRLVAGTRAPHA